MKNSYMKCPPKRARRANNGCFLYEKYQIISTIIGACMQVEIFKLLYLFYSLENMLGKKIETFISSSLNTDPAVVESGT